MIADVLNTFADGVSLNTGAAGDYVIGDVIDLAVSRDIGVAGIGSAQLWLVATVDTTATSGGAATLALSIATDDNSAMASPTKVITVPAVAVANLTRGKLITAIPLPVGFAYERYIGIVQTTGTAAFTAGKVNVFITPTPPVIRAYPDGVS